MSSSHLIQYNGREDILDYLLSCSTHHNIPLKWKLVSRAVKTVFWYCQIKKINDTLLRNIVYKLCRRDHLPNNMQHIICYFIQNNLKSSLSSTCFMKTFIVLSLINYLKLGDHKPLWWIYYKIIGNLVCVHNCS